MLAIKAKLKDAEKAKRKILEENILDTEFSMLKDGENIYFPIKKRPKKESADFEVVEIEMKRKNIPASRDLKTILKNRLTDDEFERLKTSYDTVGSIAILEIDEKLREKENIIAEALLEANKHIKTVVRKDDKHGGEFRTQKMKWLAGEETKETIYKENGVSLMLNVEDVYFSPRLSTERKRIAELVKPGEDILVMFSGCAPYPCVLAKNTPARSIVGIEINPEGHRYGLKNLELNKLRNVVLVNDDVKKATPVILQKIIGLKSAIKPNEMVARLDKNPSIIELHLENSDLFEGKDELEKMIISLKEKDIQITLHVPFRHSNIPYSLEKEDISEEEKMLGIMGELCKKYYLRAVIHVSSENNAHENNDETIVRNIKKFRQYYDYFYFENLTTTFAKKEDVLRIAKKAEVKNLCVDINHLFILYNDSDKIAECIKEFSEHYNLYFHVADHDYITHTCEIGKGKIDFNKVAPLISYGVTEVISKNEATATEQLNSYDKLAGLSHLKKFDRILMPLPKSAGDFLDDAIRVSKKGTVIHFYYFLAEDEFAEAERLVDEACDRAGRKWKKLQLVKCGQHAPHVFRICLDIEMQN